MRTNLNIEFELEEYEAIGWLLVVAYGTAPTVEDTSKHAKPLLSVFDKMRDKLATEDPIDHAKRLQQLLDEKRKTDGSTTA